MTSTHNRFFGLVCALGLCALPGCQKAETAAQAKPLEVHYVEVKPEDVIIYTDFVGTVDGVENADIRARVAGYLEERGLNVETVAPQAHLPNLVATVRGGEPGRHLVLNGHLDVFPAGDPNVWSDDPFSGAIRDGR
jgi:acetylornithine deacetylase/succinyl-diaminopimelate desuccinylase-like protein